MSPASQARTDAVLAACAMTVEPVQIQPIARSVGAAYSQVRLALLRLEREGRVRRVPLSDPRLTRQIECTDGRVVPIPPSRGEVWWEAVPTQTDELDALERTWAL